VQGRASRKRASLKRLILRDTLRRTTLARGPLPKRDGQRHECAHVDERKRVRYELQFGEYAVLVNTQNEYDAYGKRRDQGRGDAALQKAALPHERHESERK